MNEMASQIIGVSIVYWTVCPVGDQKNIRFPRHLSLWGNSPVVGEFPAHRTSDAAIFFFHLMTSSWWQEHSTFRVRSMLQPEMYNQSQFLLYKMKKCAARSTIHISLATYNRRYDTSCGKLISKPWYTAEFIGLLRHHFYKSFPLR